MFDFTVKKEDLLPSLLTVSGALDKKQATVLLSHFLLEISEDQLRITATDLELEISATVVCQSFGESGCMTVPAKKLIDIVKFLDDSSSIKFICDSDVLTIKVDRGAFKLATLKADEYPISSEEKNEVELTVSRMAIANLLQSTHFAMSLQDVRIFLSALYLDFEPHQITAIATDGHRMAVDKCVCENTAPYKLLVPRKAIQELIRLLHGIDDETILITAGKSHFKIITKQYSFLSKLVETKLPSYAKAIPKGLDKSVDIDCAVFKRALTRIMILANEKSKAVLLHMQENSLTLTANNNEKEEAFESLEAVTNGDELKIALNAGYLLDVLNHFNNGLIRLSMINTDSSILIESLDNDHYQYIIMPMKL